MQKLELSPAAAAAIVNAAGSAIGSVVTGSAEIIKELREAGIIGAKGGLTRKGSIRRERIVNAWMDASF